MNRMNSVRQSIDKTESTDEQTQLDSTSNQKRVPVVSDQLKESVEESTYLDADESFTHSKITKKQQYPPNELMTSLESKSFFCGPFNQ